MGALRNRACLVLPAVLAACAAAPRADLVGTPVPPEAATRTVTLTPEVRAVNVTGGEVVRFVAADKAFAWDFDVNPAVSSFALNDVAPPGMLGQRVIVYVTPDPRYFFP